MKLFMKNKKSNVAISFIVVLTIVVLIASIGCKIYNDMLGMKIYIYDDSNHHYVIEENIDKTIIDQLAVDEKNKIDLNDRQLDKIVYVIGSEKHECIFNIYVASSDKKVENILYIEVLPASTSSPIFLEGRLYINLEAGNRIYLSFGGNFYKGEYVDNIIAFDSKESFYEQLITNDNAAYDQLMGEIAFTDIINVYE